MTLAIVGTKSDLEHFRDVQFEEGCELSYLVDCHFCEVSIAEGYKEVQDFFLAFLRNFLRRRDKSRTEGSLRVPSIIKRTPSFERRKKSGRQSLEEKKSGEKSSDKQGEASSEESSVRKLEDRVNNNTLFAECSTNGTGKMRSEQPSATPRVKGPFNVENIKGSSREKRQLLPPALELSPPEEGPRLPNVIKVQKVKGSSASEWMRPHPAELHKAPLLVDREKDRHGKTKGPFSLDKHLKSSSTSSLRPATTNEKSRSSSSLSRVREGFSLIGKTRSLRRKPIVL